ncbi:hypothetical protein Asppvi_005553 [Aspergillus pseudoviridinutans]|uniref:GED domain-containing protein n=1 Tax=Aspergillus pseudoviridinutans TaxID=1517512 RepID=A0A9P3BFA0_9EURO|nr:uncharacterized protein Asppvi_005553 [Aspergillus pseudoviridinutans]GIJ86661.1 hypothetical protein Asppvi_005553 [Aspergillus pseudoviridinutans]
MTDENDQKLAAESAQVRREGDKLQTQLTKLQRSLLLVRNSSHRSPLGCPQLLADTERMNCKRPIITQSHVLPILGLSSPISNGPKPRHAGTRLNYKAQSIGSDQAF